MAEKTVILRPTSLSNDSAAGNFTPVPSDVLTTNAHLLINEAVPDDDATYILVSTRIPTPSFMSELPSQRGICKINCHIRLKNEGTDYDGQIRLCASKNGTANSDVSILTDVITVNSDSSEWTNHCATFTLDNYPDFFNAINNSEYVFILMILGAGQSASTGSSSKSTVVETSYTQIYLELFYETDDIYIHNNGEWTALSNQIYQKQSGAWVECGTDIFSNGDKFNISII